MLNLIQWLKKLIIKIQDDSIGAFAAQSAYFIILSFFPFVILLITLINHLPLDVDTLMTSVAEIVPESTAPTILWLMEEILRKASGTLMSITIIILLWTAGKGILAITNGLNSVNEVNESRNYIILRIISTFYTLLFAIMIVFTLALLVFGNKIYSLIISYFPMLGNIAAFVISIRAISVLLMLTVFFMLFYKVLPAKRLKFRQQIPGAVFASVGWLLCSYGFSIYVDFSKNISYMYGSLTGIILLMLWLYFCMNILFIGAEINFILYGSQVTSGFKFINR